MFKIFVLVGLLCIALAAGQDIESDEDAAVPSSTEATTDTSPSDCVDLSSDCHKNAYECKNNAYKPLMCSMCRQTCNFCPPFNGTDPCAGVVTVPPPTTAIPTAGPNQCIDTATDCAKNSYECTNTLYRPLMCKYCRRTCDICKDPSCLAFDEE